MDDRPEEPIDRRWSLAGWLWVAFWIALVTTTVLLICFAPSFFEFKGGGRRGKAKYDPADVPLGIFYCAWLGGVFGWLYWFQTTRRSQELQRASQKLGLTFQAGPLAEHGWIDFMGFPMFHAGEECAGRNRITGTMGGHSIVVLDYFFEFPVDAFGTMRKYHQTVVMFPDAAKGLPDFQLLAHESWWTKPSGKNRTRKDSVAGLQIGEESNPEFFRRFKLGGPDEGAIRNLFTHQLMNFFVDHLGWDVEVAGDHMLLYRERRLVNPKQLPEFLEQAAEVVAAFGPGEPSSRHYGSLSHGLCSEKGVEAWAVRARPGASLEHPANPTPKFFSDEKLWRSHRLQRGVEGVWGYE